MNYKELIAYASAFVSFVMPKVDVDEIILFGSVARNEADKKSDVDLFFDLKKDEDKTKEILKRELGRFYKSKICEIWVLKGIKNEINIEVGNLNEWKLKRSIISGGVVLYGKYKKVPEKMKGFAQFTLKPIKDITKRNRIIRKLFGRKEKKYFSEGAVEKLSGKRISAVSFIVPIEKVKEVLSTFGKERIDYSFFEFWSDVVL
ncbi:MAG: nucleotidyltransferase domain-containing protein [Nanoarchaeota archaeon]|nr:nucleotidyltransferase domain-containing protein [Nanoarchaeota archaeon]